MPTPRKDITGQQFGRLTALYRMPYPGQAVWMFQCECGNQKEIAQRAVLAPRPTQSCGCLQHELLVQRMTKHGCSIPGNRHPLYATWIIMRQRCNDINCEDYKYYGARGIKVCDRWNDFALFVSDMGDKPTSEHTIDRIDNNGNYEPSNCRWATWSEQNLNRRSPEQVKFDNSLLQD